MPNLLKHQSDHLILSSEWSMRRVIREERVQVKWKGKEAYLFIEGIQSLRTFGGVVHWYDADRMEGSLVFDVAHRRELSREWVGDVDDAAGKGGRGEIPPDLSRDFVRVLC